MIEDIELSLKRTTINYKESGSQNETESSSFQQYFLQRPSTNDRWYVNSPVNGIFHVVTSSQNSVNKETKLFSQETCFDILILRKPAEDGGVFPHRQLNCINVERNLTIARSGFVSRGAKLWNLLPLDLRSKDKTSSFKSGVKTGLQNFWNCIVTGISKEKKSYCRLYICSLLC